MAAARVEGAERTAERRALERKRVAAMIKKCLLWLYGGYHKRWCINGRRKEGKGQHATEGAKQRALKLWVVHLDVMAWHGIANGPVPERPTLHASNRIDVV